LLISRCTATSCLGRGLAQTLAALRAGRSGLAPCRFETADIATYVGEVAGVDDEVLPESLRGYDCRNNRLAQLGLRQDEFSDAVREAIARYGNERVAVLIGTSTAGILETELAYRQRDPADGRLPAGFNYRGSQNTFSVAEFVQRYFGLRGPATAVSTACSSSAKVFAAAARMIACGLVDAAVVGGVDSLCLTTLYGFKSLELTSPRPCRPFDSGRDGISIGEAAAFFLLERRPAKPSADDVLLLGSGESSDAYHMSSPHPQGLGARLAMEQALASAGLAASDIDYINLHGTATPSNDAAEGAAVNAVFGGATPCSSTKGATGHTLGAAGGLEAAICMLALRHGFMPGGVNTEQTDAALEVDYLLVNRAQVIGRVMSNSFGFGGTNCSLILGYAQ
jgi:3-oxoacyl-[acyl-carrier-protein] synthase-1